MQIADKYSPQEIEQKWYDYWIDNRLFHSEPDGREPYTIVIPPPNVTGMLHMGHMLNNTLQDVLVRRARMSGKNACWVPGMDHASIATEAKVVAMLHEKGIEKSSLSREKFLEYAWEWKEKYGGILCDIGSHQIEQYLFYAGEEDGTVSRSRIANYAHPQYPELDDFGDCAINGANGTTFYFRVDWFTPDGLRTWGDGRTIIIGTKGYIEIRKYVDVGTERDGGNHVFLVNDQGEQYINATGLTGYPFFGDLILDSLNRTENAMTQAHAFKAAELCLIAQKQAEMVYQAK